jgi:hypothetical protein
LGNEPPPGLVEALSDAELHALAVSLGTAKLRQKQALDTAMQEALGHVPFVLRGAAELLLT